MAVLFLEVRLTLTFQLILGSFAIIVFFPLNLDFVSRETDLEMRDFLVMKVKDFKPVLLSRCFANYFLFVIPILLCSTLVALHNFLIGESELLVQFPFFILIISLLVSFWFLLCSILISVNECKFQSHIFRILVYYAQISMLLGSMFIFGNMFALIPSFEQLMTALSTIEFFMFISMILIVLDVIAGLILLKIIDQRMNTFVRETRLIDLQTNSEKLPKHGYYSLLETIQAKEIRKPMFLVYLTIITLCSIFVNPIFALAVQIPFATFYMLFFKFPRITIEREFKMEEMLLSRISTSKYLFLKIRTLLEGIVIPLGIPSLFIFLSLGLTLMQKIVSFSLSLDDLFIMISILALILFYYSRLGYMASILIFLWRLVPAKNLVNSSIIFVLLIDVIGSIFTLILYPQGFDFDEPAKIMTILNVLLVGSPVLSNFILPFIGTSIGFQLFVPIFAISVTVSITFMLASLILLKSCVQYE